MVAATATPYQQTRIPSWNLYGKLKQKYNRRKIMKADAKMLKWAEDDATVDTNISMPKTLAEALPEDIEIRNKDPRAIVVTECSGNFSIIGCNQTWANLCGYQMDEAIGKTNQVLQGPDTNHDGLKDAVHRLMQGETTKTVTTNYRKDGSRFKCLLTMGPLHDSSGKLTHFVALLKNIKDVDPQ